VTRGALTGFDERREHRLLAWTILVVFLAGVLAFIARGADGPADPYLAPAPAAAAPPVATTVVRAPVPGFGEVAIRIASGAELCALLAQTPGQRAKGLMTRTDLAGHVGMLFTFPSPTTETFYMRNTPMPLSIAFFDNSRRFVSAIDMAPCPDIDNCPTYAAAKPYRYALEVPRGGLPGIGAGPGSVLTVGGACA
jgi:uncharacterized membrane protein (UPF0127 family)